MEAEVQNTHLHASTAPHQQNLPEQQDEGGLLTINGTLVVIIVSFVIFAIIMQNIFYGPIANIKRRRAEHIDKMKQEAAKAASDAENLHIEYQNGIKSARKSASENTTSILHKANEEKAQVLDTKKQEMSAFIKEQKQIIQSEKEGAVEALKPQIMDYAYNISKKILGEEISMAGLSPEIVEQAIQDAGVR